MTPTPGPESEREAASQRPLRSQFLGSIHVLPESGAVLRSWFWLPTVVRDIVSSQNDWFHEGCMREVQVIRAKAYFAELLRTVEYGETVAITCHGRAIAHLIPARDRECARRKEAVIRFRGRRRRWRHIEMSTDEILAARREGHRW